MDSRHDAQLPGSRACVGCRGMTFRQRDDALCPRCAFDAESLMENIEVDGLHRDLRLITEFEAYYQQRELQRARFAKFADPVFAEPAQVASIRRGPLPSVERRPWSDLRAS